MHVMTGLHKLQKEVGEEDKPTLLDIQRWKSGGFKAPVDIVWQFL